ncbi:MAG: hypothetical protein ABWZ80_10770 [Beijerinckiaceae bacterium]
MKARMLLMGAVATMLAGVPASAQDIFTNIFSAIGLTPKEQDPIDYRERAPLVVPPKTDLRQPQAPSSARNPAWPIDPDVAARRKDAADKNAPVVRPGYTDSATLTPGQLRGGPRTGSNRYVGKPLGDRNDNDNSELMLTPLRQMKAADAQREQSLTNLNPGEEPDRKSLAEPPTGYRKPTEIVRTAREPVREIDSSDTKQYLREQRRN